MIRKKSDNLNEVRYKLKMTRVELDTWVQGGKREYFLGTKKFTVCSFSFFANLILPKHSFTLTLPGPLFPLK
jgi:hypothetical protein